MDFFGYNKPNQILVCREFKITSFSYLLLFFLLVIWPLSIIIFLSPALSNLEQPVTNLIIRFYLPTLIFQMIVFCALSMIIKKENSHIASVGFDKFKYIYISYALIFLLVAGILLKLFSELINRLEIADFVKPEIMSPRSWYEIAVWIILSAVVAIVEESAYRGYLITRLTKLFKSRIAAMLIASLAFSAGHFYQGYGGVLLIFAYGVLFAGLFLYTRSIWPGILAHFIHNIIAPFI